MSSWQAEKPSAADTATNPYNIFLIFISLAILKSVIQFENWIISMNDRDYLVPVMTRFFTSQVPHLAAVPV